MASVESSRSSPYHVLVVTHGGIIKTMVTELVSSGKATVADDTIVFGFRKCLNGSVTLIDIETTGAAKVVKYADIEHLDREHLAQRVVEINVDEMVAPQDT